jgi:hypothetical protein
MRKPCATHKEAAIRFLTTPFYLFFCVVYFVVSFPQRIRRRRNFRTAPKTVFWRRCGDVPVTALDASALILRLREKEQSDEFLMRQCPSLFELLEMLWEEELSPCYRIPTVSECKFIHEQLAADLCVLPNVKLPFAEIAVWALDDHRRVFVGYCPFSGKTTDAFPDFLDAMVIHKRPPNSQGKHFAYAVSVTARVD